MDQPAEEFQEEESPQGGAMQKEISCPHLSRESVCHFWLSLESGEFYWKYILWSLSYFNKVPFIRKYRDASAKSFE